METRIDVLRPGDAMTKCGGGFWCNERPAVVLVRTIAGSVRRSHSRRRSMCPSCVLRWAALRVVRLAGGEAGAGPIPERIWDLVAMAYALHDCGGVAVEAPAREEEPVFPARRKAS